MHDCALCQHGIENTSSSTLTTARDVMDALNSAISDHQASTKLDVRVVVLLYMHMHILPSVAALYDCGALFHPEQAAANDVAADARL